MISRRALSLGLIACLAACNTTKTSADGSSAESDSAVEETEEAEVTLTPGGDCVININPNNTLPGPTFAVGYDVDGGEAISGGKKAYTFEIDSSDDAIQVGGAGGADRPTLSKNVPYAIRINDFDGTPTAFVYELNNPFGTQKAVSLGAEDPAVYKTKVFTIAVENHEISGVDYARLIVTTGSNAVSIDVNETSP